MPALRASVLAAAALLALALPGATLLHAAIPAGAAALPASAPGSPAAPASSAATIAPPIAPIHYLPTVQQAQALRSLPPTSTRSADASGGDLWYHGGPVLRVPHVILVFWGFHTTGVAAVDDPSGEEPFLMNLFSHIGGSGWESPLTQYYQGVDIPANHITIPAVQFNPAVDVIHHDPPGNLPAVIPDVLLANEAVAAANQYWGIHGYSANDQFMIATPHLRSTAEFGVVYCAYHTYALNTAYSQSVPYTNLPYQTDMGSTCGANFAGGGALDGVSIAAASEFAETLTDPFSNAWHDNLHDDPVGQEVADKCAWISSGPGRVQFTNLGGFYAALPGLWSNAIHGCVPAF